MGKKRGNKRNANPLTLGNEGANKSTASSDTKGESEPTEEKDLENKIEAVEGKSEKEKSEDHCDEPEGW